MGRTIPSFRIAAMLEQKTWKQYRKYLNNKKDRKTFDNMFSIANLYNSACSNAVNPIRIHPIMMSIIFHHYKILTESSLSSGSIGHIKNYDNDYYNDKEGEGEYNINNKNCSIILKQELDKWNNYSRILRKTDRELFQEMLLQSSYKYSDAIDMKGEQYSTESLFISLIFEQHKKMILNSNHHHGFYQQQLPYNK